MIALSQIAAFIAESSNFIGSGFWLILQLSSYVGRYLVNQIVFIFEYVNQLFQLTVAFIRVLCEDSLVFYQDIGEESSWIFSFVVTGIAHFADGVTHVSSNATLALTNTINFICDTTNDFISALWSLISLVKTCIIFTGEVFLLVGSSVWMAVTRAPIGILNCIIWIFVQLRNVLNGIGLFCLGINNAVINSVKDCTTYISNIPYSSFLGLVIGLILCYSSVKNYRTVLSVILQISRNSYCFMSSLCYNLWNGHFFESRIQSNANSLGIDDKLCIVCQERLKEVITLPCRHVCLCVQCSLHIVKNFRLCPICRSEIQTTMRIYI